MKKFLFLLIPLVLTACGQKPNKNPIEFSLSATRTNLKVEQNVKLTITLKKEKDSSRAKFAYSSSNEEVLEPINFLDNVITLKGIKDGTSTVTVTETTTNVQESLSFTVNSEEKTTMQQTYKDYCDNSYWPSYASTPSKGDINLLIIPVWFNDSYNYIINDQKKEYVRKDIEWSYLGTNEEVGYRSVKTYYEEESGEKLTINGTVTNWYDTNEDSDAYEPDDSSLTIELLREAISWAKTEEDINLTDYDSNKDGYLDGVILIYARPDFQSMGESTKNNFWAYCGRDTHATPDVDNPSGGVYTWASYDFMYGGDNRFPRTLERTGTLYGHGNPYREIIDTKTFIHEMGHMYGLYDYYDYVSTRSPAATYTMQDENVSTHDPFSYIALNWADPYIPTKSCTITIGDCATTHDVILLTPEWNEYDSAFDEYILLELYSLTGLNEHFKGDWFHSVLLPDAVGVRVWHVDARLLYNPVDGFSESQITSNVNAGNNVYKLCDNSYAKINSFPGSQRGSFICPSQNMLQLINKAGYNHGQYNLEFRSEDLFYKGDAFSLDTYKQQFLNINTGNFYSSTDKDIRLNNKKKLGWLFMVNDITTINGASTATITLTKLA